MKKKETYCDVCGNKIKGPHATFHVNASNHDPTSWTAKYGEVDICSPFCFKNHITDLSDRPLTPDELKAQLDAVVPSFQKNLDVIQIENQRLHAEVNALKAKHSVLEHERDELKMVIERQDDRVRLQNSVTKQDLIALIREVHALTVPLLHLKKEQKRRKIKS